MTKDETAILKAFCLAVIAVEGIQGGVDPRVERLAEEAGAIISSSVGTTDQRQLKPLVMSGPTADPSGA